MNKKPAIRAELSKEFRGSAHWIVLKYTKDEIKIVEGV